MIWKKGILDKESFIVGLTSAILFAIYILLVFLSDSVLLRNQRVFVGSVLFAGFIFCFLCLCYISKKNTLLETAYKFRYPIGFFFVFLFVMLEIHGSSIGMWNEYLGGTENLNTLFGKARPIRSDEWAVSTPFMLSQYFGNSPFSYFGEIVRGTETDMFIVYGQPTRDLAILFRPFHWGYLFLSPGKGLSFFWMGRIIILFLISLDFGTLLANGKKRIGLIYAFLITFAPIVQWWFAICGMAEMLIFGQSAIILLKRYIQTKNQSIRYLLAVVISWIGISYILVFYPAWQIPLFYVFLSLAIWVIWENYNKEMFSKLDFISVIVFISLILISLIYVLTKSSDTIISTVNTVYPGNNTVKGGGNLLAFFRYLGNIFFSFDLDSSRLELNMSEQASFFDLFPLGHIMTLLVIFKQKSRDKALICILLTNLFLMLWCVFPWPSWLSKITLLSRSAPNRTLLALGLTNILLLVRSIAIYTLEFSKKIVIIFSAVFSVIVATASYFYYRGYINHFMWLTVFFVLALITGLCLISSKKRNMKLLVGLVTCFMLLIGGTVNPIERTVQNVEAQSIIQTLKSINSNDEGLWIVEGMGFPYNNIPIMAGAPTINSTNVYPVLKRWEALDNNKENIAIYNRYAHITIHLSGENKTVFALDAADSFSVRISPNSLKELNVKYILTPNELTQLNSTDIQFNLEEKVQQYNIYKVNLK